ncbi:ABC transporter permease [archaeon]|nr:ABC transporter permease [archaeon]
MIISPIRKTYAYLKKDTLLLVKRKKYLYLFILLPLIIATLFLFALNPKDYNIKVGICDFDQTDISKASFQNLKGFKPIVLENENCLQKMQTQIEQGKINIGMEIGKGFSENLQNLQQSKLIVYYDNTDISFSNLISWKIDQSLQPFKSQIIDNLNQELNSKVKSIRGGVDVALEFSSSSSSLTNEIKETDDELKSLEEMNTEFLVNPIWTDKRPIYSEDLKKDAGIIYIFPILAIFIILMLASTSIIYDKNCGFITRVKASSSPILYILAKLIFFTALVAIQFLIILILFMLYGAQYAISPLAILQLILFVGIINTTLGLIIGLIANNEGIAVLFSLMISFPLMLISGVFFPVQALPKTIQWINPILPLHHQINAAKSVLLFGQSFQATWIYFAMALSGILYYLIRKNE